MDTVILGLNIKTLIYIMLASIFFLLILLVIVMRKLTIINRKYSALMSGKKGADLEKIIRIRFKEMDQVKANSKRLTREHKQLQRHLSSCFSKYGLVKYDAFNEMAGKLSFVVALLNDENTGIVLNSMHSREGCYTYAKEIIKGESYIPLSEEEKDALEQAKTVEDEIQDLTAEADTEQEFVEE